MQGSKKGLENAPSASAGETSQPLMYDWESCPSHRHPGLLQEFSQQVMWSWPSCSVWWAAARYVSRGDMGARTPALE